MSAHISQQLISEWLDGQLSANEAQIVQAHLATCGSCQSVKEELAAVTQIFQQTESQAPPPYLWTRIAAQLESHEHEAAVQPPATFWRSIFARHGSLSFPKRVFVPAAALLILLIIGGSVSLQIYRGHNQSQLAAIAEIDRAYNALIAGNDIDSSNPFRMAAVTDFNRNPFSRTDLQPNSNPFHSLGTYRRGEAR